MVGRRRGPGHDRGLPLEEKETEIVELAHFHDYLTNHDKADYQICIPSFNRPQRLCRSSLPMLRRLGADLNRVHVFVAEGKAPEQSLPEWSRYIRELRSHGYEQVHVEPGGDTLWGQMQAIFRWATEDSYIICVSDDVDDILEKKVRMDESLRQRSLPYGSLEALITHAKDVMLTHGFSAWGLSATKNALNMDTNVISRKLGLLEGNFWGVIAKPFLQELLPDSEVSAIYDVAFTTELWASGRRFFRYRGLSACTRYKTLGGMMTGKTRIQRRQEEDVQIRKLAQKHAALVNFKEKKGATLRTQQFSFSKLGPPPIRLKDPEPMKRGRKKEGFADRRMTPAERQRKHRTGQHLLMPTAKRPAQANIEAVEKRESQSLSREHESLSAI